MISTIFPQILATTLGFECREQSTVLVVQRRDPRFMRVSDVHGGGSSAQILYSYKFSYGTYFRTFDLKLVCRDVLIFVLSRVCEEYDVEIQWLQSKKKCSYAIKFRTFSKVRNVRK